MSILLLMPQEPQAGAGCIPLQGDKWRSEEDARLIELVEKGMSWKDIAEEMPGRSERSCYVHYKRLLKRIENDSKTDKIVRLYNRYNPSHPGNQNSAYIVH